jgi:hypothetical protein
MFIVALVFAIVFLFRDVQVLAVQNPKVLGARFSVYALLVACAMGIFAGTGESVSGIFYTWTERRFAMAAVIIQLIELAIGIWLRRFALGQHSWLGCILPSPAFLIALIIVTYGLQQTLLNVTAVWLALVGSLAFLLHRLDNPLEDRKFAADFALMTSCTALIFVPFGILE